MRTTGKTSTTRGGLAFLLTGALVLVAAGCGEEDFKNEKRPPVPIELTGVIQEDKVTVSPNGRDTKVGAGPIVIIISNQTEDAHTVTLEGDRIPAVRVGPINPLDTASIQKTLPRGIYEVRAGSEVAVPKEIRPAELRIGPPRDPSNNRLLLP
jgi:hypothetical protein